jgi:tripartite-type tricarboxylate transporter receptor subunit TctC
MTMTKRILVALSLLAMVGAAQVQIAAQAQAFPDRPITMIVPFAAGGAADATGRIIAEAMGKALGKAVIVENTGGGGGAIGTARTKNAEPNGYVIGLGHTGTLAAAVTVTPKLAYNPRADFEYLGLVAVTPNIIFVRNDFPAKNLKEFIAVAREKKEALNIGHSGNGAASHITCLLFFGLIQAKPSYIPYRGFGLTINDIVSGTIDGSCDLVASVSGQVQSGLVRALVVAAKDRSETLPDVPTSAEAGLPEFQAETWTGLFAPKGTPKPVLDILEKAVATAVADPDTKKRLATIGARAPQEAERGGDSMRKLVNSEIDRWADILNKAGFKPE